MNGFLRRWDEALMFWRLACGRLRARWLALRGARVGIKAAVGARCVIDRPWCVQFDDRVQIEADVYVKIVADNASLRIGRHTFVGRGVEFDVMCDVSVGPHSLIAPGCFITDHVHGIRADVRVDQQPCVANSVTIGSDVWLGTGTVVLPGVNIGDGAVVGANSVVTSDVSPYTVVTGAPARFLRNRSVEEIEPGDTNT